MKRNKALSIMAIVLLSIMFSSNICAKTKSLKRSLGLGILAGGIGMGLASQKAHSQEWYKNGTLHKSTISEWLSGSYQDQLATSADWALKSPSINKKVMDSKSIDTLKPFATQLVECVNTAATEKTIKKELTATIAASCEMIMGWH